jgi:hypothetical protein
MVDWSMLARIATPRCTLRARDSVPPDASRSGWDRTHRDAVTSHDSRRSGLCRADRADRLPRLALTSPYLPACVKHPYCKLVSHALHAWCEVRIASMSAARSMHASEPARKFARRGGGEEVRRERTYPPCNSLIRTDLRKGYMQCGYCETRVTCTTLSDLERPCECEFAVPGVRVLTDASSEHLRLTARVREVAGDLRESVGIASNWHASVVFCMRGRVKTGWETGIGG